MELSLEDKGNAQVITIKGRMDAVSAPKLDSVVAETIDSGKTIIIISFAELEYISSAGLRSVLATAKKMKSLNGSVLLAALNGSVKEVFTISGFDTIFKIFDSVDQALSTF